MPRTMESDRVQRLRAGIDHPIIDSDAHILEFLPDVRSRLRSIGGADVVRRFDRHYWTMDHSPQAPLALRRHYGISHPPWWTYAAENTFDRATAMLPALLHERLPALGIDFAVVYPSYFIQFPMSDHEDFRRAGCRATNEYLADTFRGLEDRLTPVAPIPTHTPEEALDEINHVLNLGFKAVVLTGVIPRTVPSSGRIWLDTLGLESEHDYEPVWDLCEQRGLAVTFHTSGMGWGSRASMTNFMHNHLGHFAAAGDATARSLLFAGVPVRHPKLRFAFLEGGVGWAAALFAQMASHHGKRNRDAIRRYNPIRIDKPALRTLMDRYATSAMRQHLDELDHAILPLSTPLDDVPDEFATTLIGGREELAEVFERSLFFGCEGDDPLTVVASARFGEVLGARMNAIYGSDIGHWDVPDISEVLLELYELVEQELLAPEDLRRMVFDNPVSLWAGNNARFFEGTAVEAAVAELQP